ncbi:MAG: hypothetical protein ACUVQ0_04685 [Thermoproteota archaeon]
MAVEDAEIMTNYSSGIYAGRPDIAMNRFGKGLLSMLEPSLLQSSMMSWLAGFSEKALLRRCFPVLKD